MSTKPIPTILALIVCATMGVEAQQGSLPIQDGQLLQLWSGPAPGALGADASDIPAITVFLPRVMTANTPAMVVCPGGGYVNLAMNHEGRQVASYLNSLGMAAFVLRSRLGPRYHHPTELGDAHGPFGCCARTPSSGDWTRRVLALRDSPRVATSR